VQAVGWRGLFAVLGGLSAGAALLILVVVPERRALLVLASKRPQISLMTIYWDRRFWRLAPLSAVGVGTSWSLQGLWAAPWLKDVDGFNRMAVIQQLSIMAIAVSASGLLLGLAADRVRRLGIKTERVLACTLSLSMLAQLALVLGWPVPSCMAWSAVAAAGAATVLSYAILAEYFPKEASGRANAALNLLHVGAAFVLQSFTGLVIEQWPAAGEHYPVAAHQSAMALILVLQLAALAWFVLAAQRQQSIPALRRLVERLDIIHTPRSAYDLTSFRDTLGSKKVRVRRHPDGAWRAAAAGSALVCFVLLLCLIVASGPASIAAHVIEAGR
jgi:MFS family permease